MFSSITSKLLKAIVKPAGHFHKAGSKPQIKALLNCNTNYFSTVAAYAVYRQNTSKLSFQEKEQRALKNLRGLTLQEAVAVLWEGAEQNRGSNLLWNNLEEKLVTEVNKMSEIDLALTIWSFGELRRGGERIWVDLERRFLELLSQEEFSSSSLSKCLYGFAINSKGSAKLWKKASIHISSSFKEMDSESLCLTLFSFAKINENTKEKDGVIKSLSDEFEKIVDDIDLRTTAIGVWSLSLADNFSEELERRITNRIINYVGAVDPRDVLVLLSAFSQRVRGTEELWQFLLTKIYEFRYLYSPEELAKITELVNSINLKSDSFWSNLIKVLVANSSKLQYPELSLVVRNLNNCPTEINDISILKNIILKRLLLFKDQWLNSDLEGFAEGASGAGRIEDAALFWDELKKRASNLSGSQSEAIFKKAATLGF